MTQLSQLGWYGLPRQAIPGVMLGMEPVGRQLASSPETVLQSGGADLAVAFDLQGRPEMAPGQAPCLAVFTESKLSDLLGWLHTYSAETFPLSQYCRVLSLGDWRLLSDSSVRGPSSKDASRWASLVAGEMLGQGDVSGPVSSAPLGWAHGCFSFAMARTKLLYGDIDKDLSRVVAERMAVCEADGKLQNRRINQSSLAPTWAIAASEQDFDGDPKEVAHTVMSALSPKLSALLRSSQALASSSAEQRVIGFEAIAKEGMALAAVGGPRRPEVGAVLAAAAFLVGNGTSHIGLLEPHARDCPEAYAWFGLLAGLAGPKTWDQAWMRLSKGVQRLIADAHSLVDSPQADLSWAEYQWLSVLSDQADIYSSIPKLSQRLLTVEIFSGVTCQFRANAGASHAEVSTRPTVQKRPIGDHSAMTSQDKLSRARVLAGELQSLLAELDDRFLTGQQPLFAGSSQQSGSKKRSSKIKART